MVNRPQLQFEEIVLDHINVKRYIKGKVSAWQPIDITLYDPIVPSVDSICFRVDSS